MLRRGVEKELLSFCTDNHIGVVAYSPMQEGLLSGRMTAERVAQLEQDDHRAGATRFSRNPG